MTQTEIQNAGTTSLTLRLAVVEYSTITAQAEEAAIIATADPTPTPPSEPV